MNDQVVPPFVDANTPSWQPCALPQPLLPPEFEFGAIDCTWAYTTSGLLGATARSIRPIWLPLVALTYGLPLPALRFAPVVYGLPATCVPKTKPVVLPAIDVNAGQPL